MMDINTLYLLLVLSPIQLLLAEPTVELPSGSIRGLETKTIANKTFFAFKNVPFAAPPVGDFRFKPPQPVTPWKGVLDTTQFGHVCFQTCCNNEHESEDCLYLNIFTPQLPGESGNKSLPVMLYIHGGGFVDGSGMYIAPDLYMNNDVILVSVNYRVGVFGFISTQDEVIPGNNGLKDQQFAIKWVHNNIHLFGGDPNQLTIFGQSAGSASCAYQLLNQKNKGLFQAAILQSGSFLSPWTYQRRARRIAFDTASFLKASFAVRNDSRALLEFLLTVKARDLDKAAESYRNFRTGPQDIEISQGFYYAPVVEVENPEAFLTEKMYGLLKKGEILAVPTLMGITSEENLSFNADSNRFKETMATFDKNWAWIVPNDMQISNLEDRTEMGRLIRDLYTGGKPLADNLGDAMRYCSDTSFTRSVIKHAELYSNLSSTYFYVFSYDGDIGNFGVHYDGAEAVAHSEDIPYLFCTGNGCDDSRFPESDRITRQRMIKLWTNFAKFKNPTPKPSELLQNLTWPVVDVTEGDFLYVDFGKNLEIKNHPKEKTYKRWNELYDSLNYTDFDTY